MDDSLVKSYTYDAYGNTQSTGAFINSFAYTGAVIDTETGLYYMNARYYDPETGRFISQDTYRGSGEAFWHLYLYCSGDPVNATDPSGHKIVYSKIRPHFPTYAVHLSPLPNYLSENYPQYKDYNKYLNFSKYAKGINNTNINPEFRNRLAYLAYAYSQKYNKQVKIYISWGYRTYNEQLNSGSNASAGTSWHEFGLAIDACKGASANKWIHNLKDSDLKEYGLGKFAHDVNGNLEYWHIGPIECKNIRISDHKSWALKNSYYPGIEWGFKR